MKVKVRFFAELREIVGIKEKILEVTNSPTIYNVLNLLVNIYGKTFEEKIFDEKGGLSENYIILLNGKNIRLLKGLDTTLQDGDEIAIFPPVAGG